jgi:hypothetical protein
MIFISAEDIKRNFTVTSLMDAIESIYIKDFKVPIRHIHNID